MTNILHWTPRENFNEDWKNRIAVMASLLTRKRGERGSVLDLGCGMQWLKEILPPYFLYYPVDCIKRSDNTIVCDFNKYEFPCMLADFSFVSGVIEYINDHEWFISKISQQTKSAIISYLPITTFGIEARKKCEIVNNFEKQDIIFLFGKYSMELIASKTYNGTDIFKFIKY